MPRKNKDWLKEWEDLSKEVRRMSKRANQRMVRLERYAKLPSYSNITKYAYKIAQKEISSLYGKKGKKLRYTESPKMQKLYDENGKELKGQKLYKANVQLLKNQKSSIEKFLGSASSTLMDIKDVISGKKKLGYLSVEKKRTKTINDNFLDEYGLKMSRDDLTRFFNSKKQAKLESIVGSQNMFVVAAIIKKYDLKSNKRDMARFFKEHIDLKEHPEILKSDLNAKNYDDAGDMFNTLSKYMKFTGDEQLDLFIGKALSKGINVANIFI